MVKFSHFISVLLVLSIAAMSTTAVTSGHVTPMASPTFTFFPSFTYLPSITFSFPTFTSSTHIFTFIPSFTFFTSVTSSTSTLPTATSTVQQTDWTVLSIAAIPMNPQPGDQVIFSMNFAALSSNAPFPQAVYIQCQIDGFSCGAGTVTYSGPTGGPATVSSDSYWPASPGTHILTWYVGSSNDPNPGNNAMSLQFFVPLPQAPTTVVASTQMTQVSATATQPPTTVIQTSVQTVTQPPATSSTLSGFGGIQNYTLPLLTIIIVLIAALALTTRKRKTASTGSQSNAWFCTKCGTQNSFSDNFCGKCGTARRKA